ncbi:MAG: protein-L-isoaspartate(D-aspartate) O-methyltransferase [Methylomonas sp.]|nr:protein-L-isoaspartate(D-aspartate) O-methyltransferase [Methylomonas sp.]
MSNLQQMLEDIEKEVDLTRHFIGKDRLDSRVMVAMESIPRHEFLPEDLRYLAYRNGPAPIGSGQTISQPFIVALMTDLLETKPEHDILEIGTGSGYQAAVLSQLVSCVYSVEIIERLAADAGKRLQSLGYANVVVRNDNGYHGWPEHAPYDGIIVTAAAPHVPQSLVDQLRIGARLVLPVGHPYGYQELIVIEKKSEHQLESRTILGVRFVPMTGVHNKSPD